MGPVGMAAHPEFLDMLEAAHREEVGEQFCYCAVPWIGAGSDALQKLAIVRANEGGYYPISEDFFFGDLRACHLEADRLNRERRDLTPRQSALMIASSLQAEFYARKSR